MKKRVFGVLFGACRGHKKRACLALLGLLLAGSFTGCQKNIDPSLLTLDGTYDRTLSGTTLNICNWGEYIADGSEGSLPVVELFQELTGIRVNYTFFDTNETLYAKIAGGAADYDLITPSDYLIERLIAEERLAPLEKEKLSNLHYILPEYHGLYFDPEDRYSVPYTSGMVGLIYNETLVTPAPTSWNALWDPRYQGQILQFDSPRDAFGTAQYLLGLDVNSTDPADWNRAGQKLREQAPLVQAYVADEIYQDLAGTGAAMGAYYAGDFLLMQEDNPDLRFVYPEEGTNLFYDNLCIPEDAKHKEAATLFINFLLEPEIALANAEFNRYVSPHRAVRLDPAYSLRENPILYPQSVPQNLQSFKHLPQKILNLMNQLWTELKQTH